MYDRPAMMTSYPRDGRSRSVRKTPWFEEGLLAFQRARPTAPAMYLCPICLHGFSTSDGLSIDHFPPQSLGGRSAVLTCTECNNHAGSELEADMKPAESLYDFAAGEMSEPAPGEYAIGGHTLKANIQATGNAVLIFGAQGAGNPAVEQALKERLDERSEEGAWADFEIKLSFGTHRCEDALAGWLRSAYLAVFSAWGYSYIFRSPLNVVREQIAQPRSKILRVFSLTLPKPEFDEPHISLIDQPPSLAGHLFVGKGRHAVFLPGLHGNGLYEELARQSDAGLEANVSAVKEIPWPTRPRYELDIALSDGS